MLRYPQQGKQSTSSPMTNLYTLFKSLLPSRPLEVGKVISSDTTGCYVTLPAGGTMYVRGNAAVGTNVFVRDGVIEGAAPNLTVQSIDV